MPFHGLSCLAQIRGFKAFCAAHGSLFGCWPLVALVVISVRILLVRFASVY